MKDDNYLIENAILAFLHHYPEHEYKESYLILLDKVRTLKNGQPTTTETRKRGRPAKKARTKETSSTETSKEESKTT
jgi:hypothetical protein